MAGGQYKLMFERLLGPHCDALYEDHVRPFAEELFSATNYTDWYLGLCPIPAGYVQFKNYIPSTLGNYLPPYVPGGEKWKATFYYLNQTDSLLGGFSVYATLRSNYSLLRYGG